MRAIILCSTLLLAACGQPDAAPDTNTAAARFVPPATERPTPLPGQANATPLTAYVGRYPQDALAGVGFFDRTEVANALIDAVGDDKVRRTITSHEATTVPIFALADGRIAAHGCEAHNCDDRNWTFTVASEAEGGALRGEACYHDAATMGDTSRWYAGAAPVTRPGACPQGKQE